jgi:hypothetical protein
MNWLSSILGTAILASLFVLLPFSTPTLSGEPVVGPQNEETIADRGKHKKQSKNYYRHNNYRNYDRGRVIYFNQNPYYYNQTPGYYYYPENERNYNRGQSGIYFRFGF